MSVEIIYNNINFFNQENLATPQIERSTSNIIFGKKRGLKEHIILSGTIHIENPPQNCDYKSKLIEKRDKLINFFSEEYKGIQLKEGGIVIFEKDFCEIKNISFDSANYVKLLEYSVEIDCYDEELHNEFFGIADPVNSTTIQLGVDKIYKIDRNISASGENLQTQISNNNVTPQSSSLKNAIDFVNSLSGEDNVKMPEGHENLKLHLIEHSENIDRIKNSYSITESYIADSLESNQNNGILRYSTQRDSDAYSYDEISISGNLKFGKNFNFTSVQNRFKEIDLHQIVVDEFNDTSIRDKMIECSITEKEDKNEIDFSARFSNNDSHDDCFVNEVITYSISNSAEKVSIGVSGKIEAIGPQETRWEKVNDYFRNKSYDTNNFSSWINEQAQEQINIIFQNTTLNKEPTKSSIQENKDSGEIVFNYEFSNDEIVEDFKNLEISIAVENPISDYSVDINFGGGMDHYIISSVGTKQGTISIAMQGTFNDVTGNHQTDRVNAINAIKTKAETKFSEISQKVMGSRQYSVTNSSESYNINDNKVSFTQTRNYFEKIV